MISYEGVIRKRLRLKGHPEIPPYKPRSPESDAPPSAVASASGSTPVPTVNAAIEDLAGALSGNVPVSVGASADEIRTREEGDNPDEITPVNHPKSPGLDDLQQFQDATPSPAPSEPSNEGVEKRDLRTVAEKRYDDAILEREEGLMRKAASRSYREKVDVCLHSSSSTFIVVPKLISYIIFITFSMDNVCLTFFL